MLVEKENALAQNKKFIYLILFIAGFSVVGQLIPFLIDTSRYLSWTKTTAKFVGKNRIQSIGKSTLPSCNFTFEFEFNGARKTEYTPGDCFLLIPGTPAIGSDTIIAYEPSKGGKIISKTVHFGISVIKLLFFLMVFVVIGVVLWLKKLNQKKQ